MLIGDDFPEFGSDLITALSYAANFVCQQPRLQEETRQASERQLCFPEEGI